MATAAKSVIRVPRLWKTKRGGAISDVDIVKVRAKLSMTQREFATFIGCSPRAVEHWEQGRVAPSGAARVLIALAGFDPGVMRRFQDARSGAVK